MTPRHVPAGLIARIFVFSPLGLAGTLALLFGQIFGWVFVPFVDVSGLWEWRGEVVRDVGTVVAVRPTSTKVNSRRVYAIEFEHGDGPRRGVSYAVGSDGLAPGTSVAVEQPAGRPEGARIVGLSRKPFPAWALLAALVPAVVGLGLLAAAAVLVARRLRLLRLGEPATGKLVEKVATNVRVNRRRVYRFSYEFVTLDGRSGRAVARTHRLDDLREEGEPLLYDPETLRATPLAHLPGRPRVEGDAVVASSGGPAPLGAALLVAAATAGWIALVVVTVT